MFSKLQALMPDGRHRMLYTVGTPPEVYEVHFNEIVDYDDSLLEIPDGILTGVRPTLLNQMGGCYEIAFDLVSNIKKGTSFEPPKSYDPNKLGTIIDRAIIYHYNRHRPYCYTFLAYSPALSRLYMRTLMKLRHEFSDRIYKIHTHLEPGRRGYVIEFKTKENS
ncbi:Uncharacterised protein [Klebsiella pneumoniae]|nr:Uncharacterised protein [Klebsiella pneumoniae]